MATMWRLAPPGSHSTGNGAVACTLCFLSRYQDTMGERLQVVRVGSVCSDAERHELPASPKGHIPQLASSSGVVKQVRLSKHVDLEYTSEGEYV